MLTTITCRKLDNGFKAIITDWDIPEVVHLGEELFNRNFKPYATDEIFKAVVNVSPKGRRIVKSTYLVEEASVSIKPKPKSIGSGYYINQEARHIFNTAHRMALAEPKNAVKVMMVGGSGYGKTTLPRLFAEATGRSFLRMNCATVRDPEEWFGYREAQGGSTLFVRSEFAKAVARGHLVVVLDEFNRLEPWLHNTLFPLLDDDGCTVVHGEEFCLGPDVIVVGTINTGYKYTGTFELDEALLNRFDLTLEVGPMPHAEEVSVLIERTGIEPIKAGDMVRLANTLRQMDVVCSTRSTLTIAKMCNAGMSMRMAFEGVIVRRIPQSVNANNLRKSVVDAINVAIGSLELGDVDNDIFSDIPGVSVAPEHKDAPKYRIIFERVKSANLVQISFISALMSLKVSGGSLSRDEANDLSNRLRDGETIILDLDEIPGEIENFRHWMSTIGIIGRIEKL